MCSDASIIQRLYDYVEAERFTIYGADGVNLSESECKKGSLCVYTATAFPESIAAYDVDGMCGCVNVVLSPRENLKRYELCRDIIASHNGLSIDCRTMTLFFYCCGLSKEHIKL